MASWLHHFKVAWAAFRGPTTTTTDNGCFRYFISFRIFIIFAKVRRGHVHITVVTRFHSVLVSSGRNKERWLSRSLPQLFRSWRRFFMRLPFVNLQAILRLGLKVALITLITAGGGNLCQSDLNEVDKILT